MGDGIFKKKFNIINWITEEDEEYDDEFDDELDDEFDFESDDCDEW